MRRQNIYANCALCHETIYVFKKYTATSTVSSELFFARFRGILDKNIGYLCIKCYKNIRNVKGIVKPIKIYNLFYIKLYYLQVT
ncbi:hypothetical protein [Rachiplusia nu nucleopolyhedrovirus]|uniref:Uncharacterized protein n=1 Tax=Rachiplusia nu nucleopolyhedrovirus TaxID=2605775 RepID=A0AAE6M5N7_9ABAC|nr:hypothetical protein QKQ55_gp035 [Rachiplusia nu nucleopolyhedrovirus]QEI03591.1 hypothetical protein [Rachiplusia nu nucleopolyhedrovirus]